MKFTFLLFLVLSCFVNSAFSSEKHPWECKEEDWDKKPQMIDGVFHSTLSIECQFSKESPFGFDHLSKELQKYLQEDREIHGEPQKGSFDGIPSLIYDTTLITNQNEKGHTKKSHQFRIRETVELATDGKRFLYQTQSQNIEARGMASYLRSAGFQLAMTKEGSIYTAKMKNPIAVKRPWYALAPLFFIITKGVAKDKFEEARNMILQEIFMKL